MVCVFTQKMWPGKDINVSDSIMFPKYCVKVHLKNCPVIQTKRVNGGLKCFQ